MAFSPLNLHVNALSCKRGDRLLFDQLGFQLQNGKMIELKGPNGVGKSSLLRLLAGLSKPHQGEIMLDDAGDIFSDLSDHAHYLSHLNGLKNAFSVEDNLKFWRGFSDEQGVEAEKALALVDLPHVLNLPCGVLSAGQKRRVAFARLLVAKRPVWLLDEPTAALDKEADKIVGSLISNHLAQGGLVIAATHLPLQINGESSTLSTINLDDYRPHHAYIGDAL